MKNHEDVFLFCTEAQMQVESQEAIGRKLKPKELKYLKRKIAIATLNLIIKIGESGTRQ